MSTYQTSNVACGILYLISEVMKEKPDLYIKDQPLYQKTLDDDDDDGEVYEDVKDEDDDDSKSDDEVEEKNKIKRESENYRKLVRNKNLYWGCGNSFNSYFTIQHLHLWVT